MEELRNLHGSMSDKLEVFVNDYLREDLKIYETQLNRLNNEISEYIQLKNMIECIEANLKQGFKTQMDIGGNFFMQAKIENTENILINVGCDHFVEFTLPEGLKFCQMKINVLNKQADIIREESIKTRAHIKLVLMSIADERNRLMNKENIGYYCF